MRKNLPFIVGLPRIQHKEAPSERICGGIFTHGLEPCYAILSGPFEV